MADSSLVSALRATPRNELLGGASDLMNQGLSWLDNRNAKTKLLAEILRGTGVPKTVERMAYGEPLTNIGKANVPLLKPETADFAMTVAPMVGPASRGAGRLVGNAINDAMVYGQGPLASITPQPMKMFVGEKSKTWDTLAATKAKELEKAGVSPQEIWKETGTFKGPDGFYRQEIDDSLSRLDAPTLQHYQNSQANNPERLDRLSGVLSHKKVYNAYPEIQNIGLDLTGKAKGGAYAEKTNISPEAIALGQSKDQKSTLLHEMQHAIQQRENFVRGGSLKDFSGDFEMYRRLAGEAEARATQARMNMTPEQRRAVFPLDSYDVPIDQLIFK